MQQPTVSDKIRVYSHETLQGALAELKMDLGANALILHTRQVRKKGKFGIGAQAMFEIQACPAPKGGKKTQEPKNKTWIQKNYDMTHGNMQRKMRSGNENEVDRRKPQANSETVEKMSSDIEALKRMVQEVVLRSREKNLLSGLSEELQNLNQELLRQGVSDLLARELVQELNLELTGEDLKDPKRLMEELQHKVGQRINVSAAVHDKVKEKGPMVVAFIGPTGVGKTTTISKLAGYCHHYESQKVALITLDTYRIAAADQLQRVAQIVDVPIRVETSPQGMRRSLDEFAHKDIVFIDTAGRSQRDTLHMNDLKNFLDAAEPDEVHLVIPSHADGFTLHSIIESFGPMATHICLSKLDEALRLGTMMETIFDSDLPLTYWTFGQSIPDDIAVVEPRRLARLLLGQEKL
jgi:flagellar biosynthesis protein FlhF